MITITRVKRAVQEFIKVLRFGKSDIQTSDYCLPAGIDSKPVKEDQAVQADTSNSEQTIILGYIKNFKKTSEGETRIYATDKSGNEKFSIYLKNDGTCEINGNSDNLIRYNPLSSELKSFSTKINAELLKISSAITSLGGVYPAGNVSIDISQSKIDNLKTE